MGEIMTCCWDHKRSHQLIKPIHTSFIIYPQAEHERQMKAAEEEVRHQKLQAELDQARVNAGKVAVSLIIIAVIVGIIVIVTVLIIIIELDQYQDHVYCYVFHSPLPRKWS